MKSTLSVLIRNQVGVVSDATEVFKAHNINLHSVSCSETEAFDVSRLIITLEADDVDLATIRAFLAEKDFVIEVEDWSALDLVDRELALVKVNVTRETTTQIMQVGEVFRATVVDMGPASLTFEATGDMRRIDSFIKMLRPFGIKCLARTGAIALLRNDR